MPKPKTLLTYAGFTLIELLIVITIIVIMIAIGVASYSTAQRNSRNAQRAADLQKIAAALEEYYADHNSYPSTRSDGAPNGTWEAASGATGGDHTNCLLGGTWNTNFVPTAPKWDWCGMNQAGSYVGGTIPVTNTSNLPTNVYIANGDFTKFPRDPLNGVAYCYISNGQTYALATRTYEGTAPNDHLFNSTNAPAIYWSAALNNSPWPAQLANGNQYFLLSPNH